MKLYYKNLKFYMMIAGALIVASSLFFTNKLVGSLAKQERQKMELWAEATRQLVSLQDANEHFDFIWKIIEGNEIIPVIIVDDHDNFISARNFNVTGDEQQYYKEKIQTLKTKNPPIEIDIDHLHKQYIYYDDSILLKQLALFPYIQLSVIAFFLIISFVAFSSSKRAEQDRVWVGLSKETAHQLGTPISSLLAWVELLKNRHHDDKVTAEMGKDVDRLKTIAERFSKIGSIPEFQVVNLNDTVSHAVAYMRNRTSKKINYLVQCDLPEGVIPLNVPLFEWVIENLSKNAIDAMDGCGTITYEISFFADNSAVVLDITDTGKGIEKSKFKTIFQPGFTTKSRGWGLGLSLVKRIVEEYHQGRIFVKSSELGAGTTFRLLLPLN